MNSPKQNAYAPNQPRDAAYAEETLRLIAGLPATEGLEERLKAGLKAAPKKGRVLAWADPSKSGGGWMRSTAVRAAAAAAIVCVVAGGGWSVYSRVQPAQMPKVIAMPQRVAAPGGFSSAGAMRTPQTLNGPVLVTPATKPANGTVGTGTKKVIPIKSAVNKIGHATKAAAAAR